MIECFIYLIGIFVYFSPLIISSAAHLNDFDLILRQDTRMHIDFENNNKINSNENLNIKEKVIEEKKDALKQLGSAA